MNEREKLPLNTLIGEIIVLLEAAGLSEGTVNLYRRFFKRLIKMASSTGVLTFDHDLAQKFIADSAYRKTGGYCHSRFLYHTRCVRFIESYISDGTVDLSIMHPAPSYALKEPEFQRLLHEFEISLDEDGLKKNTKEGYVRLVTYFLLYLEDKKYHKLDDVRKGDILFFMVLVCQEHYSPTSLGSHITGLRRFVKVNEIIRQFEHEIPEHLPKKAGITPSYTEEEIDKVNKIIIDSSMSARDRAIAAIAFETGLRAVDICNLKLCDIDWKHDAITIVQEKTGKQMTIPMLPMLGNALMAYILEERPAVESPYVFLRTLAPFTPFHDHSGIYNVLRKIVSEAGIEPDGRISGTRMTRHTHATHMMRNGVPLPVIAQALGHNSPDSTMRYLSTDNKTMAECTLPLPKKGGRK